MEIQELPKLLVFLRGSFALADLFAQFRVLLLQLLHLLLDLAVVEHVGIDALRPVRGSGNAAADGSGDGIDQVGQGIGVAPHKGGGQADEDAQQQGDDQKPNAVVAKKVLHDAPPFLTFPSGDPPQTGSACGPAGTPAGQLH